MRAIALTLAIVGAILATHTIYSSMNSNKVQSSSVIPSRIPQEIQDAFTQWKMDNNKSYGTDSQDAYRLQVFSKNYKFVNSKNSEKRSYTVALNKYADLGAEEFKKQYLSLKPSASFAIKTAKKLSTVGVADEHDWVSQGAVSPVKDQGQCGSCWAFSTTGAIEGLQYIQNNYLFYFSEQQLVDCAHSYGNNGCEGGLMDHAFLYTAVKGVTQEAEYPYTARDGTCNTQVEATGLKINTGHEDVAINDNDQLVAAINQQPVSVGIAAEQIQFYKSGVYDDWDNCGDQLDHGVLAVGYGTDSASGKLYYKIKNSWGASFGEAGYFRIERRTGQSEGICGVTKNASYPTHD